VPRVACVLPPSADFPKYARFAEELGYTRVWAFDSPALYGDVWIALARAAEATECIGLATGVAVPFSRHVMVTASAIASVAELAPGRLACAFGTGFSAAKALGRKPAKWSEMRTFMTRLRGLLNGDIVDIDGAMCRMLHSPGFAPPRPIDVPLYLAPIGPKGLAAARDLADGVILAVPHAVSGWQTAALLVSGTVLDSGESHETPRVVDAFGPGFATGIHAMWEWRLFDMIRDLPGGSEWLDTLADIPENQRHLAVHEGHLVVVSDRDKAIVQQAGPRLLENTWSGSPDVIRKRAEGLAHQGVSEIVYNPTGSDIYRELATFAQAMEPEQAKSSIQT